MKIALACDHGGFPYKDAIIFYLISKGHEVIDFGTNSEDSCDYPDYCIPACNAVASNEADYGILICGTGIGMSICANKIAKIRCAHVTDEFSAEMTRKHNNSNVLALGARISTKENVIKFIDIFLNTNFEGGRHSLRVEKLNKLDY
ncbi:MAG: ribose 5-phosphate isomerase B [Clostridia bacterium]|nr:ribose 5-phosphate isomerase B [Clostridia bacterium]